MPLTKISYLTLLVLIIGTSMIDLLHLVKIDLGLIGVTLWIIIHLIIFIYSVYRFFLVLYAGRNNKLTIVVVVTLLLMAFVGLTTSTTPSGEITQEIACALNHFSREQDFGFWKTCLFGYPARQLFLPALISLVFGRNIITLQLGGFLYFFMGMSLFSYGAITYLDRHNKNLEIAPLLIALIPHFYFVNHFLFYFEQSIFPFCLALSLVGIYLDLISHLDKFKVIIFLALSLLSIYSYTPSLALFPLIIMVFITILGKKTSHYFRLLAVISLFLVVFHFLSSFRYRTDLNLLQTNERSYPQLVSDLQSTYKHLVYNFLGSPYASNVGISILLLTITLSFSGIAGHGEMFLSWWVIGTFIMAIISKGYTYYGIEFRLHRSLVSLPLVLYLGLSIITRHMDNPKLIKILATIIFVTGILYQYDFVKNKEKPNLNNYQVIKWVIKQNHLSENSEGKIIFYGIENTYLSSFRDMSQYFLPRLDVAFINDGYCYSDLKSKGLIQIVGSNSKCIRTNPAALNTFNYRNEILLHQLYP